MKYLIMLIIVIGLAAADFVTGWIKAYIAKNLSSTKMRIGGLHKLVEILIMLVACGLEIGLEALGRYYSADSSEVAQKLATISGTIVALLFFLYIFIMELTSILENYYEIDPEAKWALWLVRKLRIFNEIDDKEDKK